MPRQTITLTEPNHKWLQDRVDSGEFRTQTEAVNDAIRKLREKEDELAFLRDRIARAKEEGFTTMNRHEILAEIKDELRRDGKL